MSRQKLYGVADTSNLGQGDADNGVNSSVTALDGAPVLSQGLFAPQSDGGGPPEDRDHGSTSPIDPSSHIGHYENSPHGPATTPFETQTVSAASADQGQGASSTPVQLMSKQAAFANQPAASGSPAVADALVSPSLDAEVAYISGIDSSGLVAATTSQTWNGDGPDSSTPNTVATYNQTSSNAAKWAPGGPSAGASTAGSAGGTQSYYFDPASNFTAAQQAALTSGLALWSAVANIQFTQVTAATAAANPSLAALDFKSAPSGGTFEQSGSVTPEAIGSSLLNNQGVGASLTVNIDPNNGGFDLGNFNNGGSGVGVILHEEGHFLGLGHSGPYNGAVNPATQQFSAYDSHEYSLMSYIGANDPTGQYASSNPNPGATNYGDSTTWMPLDILAVQRLYGAATSGPLSGGQVFGYHDNVDGLTAGVGIHNFYDFSAITTPVVTLYDTGTGNTLDLSGDHSAETIDLRPGDYSSFAGDTDNLAIAYNTAIDTFVGGTGGATVTANTDSDVFTFSGTGNTVVLSGSAADYTVTNPSQTQAVYTQTASGRTYTANNAQNFQFQTACYAPRTHIATPSGEALIKTLSIGDLVLTASGQSRPIRWIGRRSYAPRFARHNKDVWPVLIRAGALAGNVPVRDLFVSPLHAMYLDGLLVPATELVNGVSIVQPRPIDQIDYIHIELDTHDVILAEGAPSESFVDDESRMGFHNALEYFELYLDAVRQPALYCAPRVTEGFALAVIRQRIAVRAGLSADTASVPLRGFLDHVDSHLIEGWAQNPNHPEAPVCIDVVVDGVMVAQTLANRNRGDLMQAGMGSGRHAFSVRLPTPLTPRQIQTAFVQRSSDRARLPYSAASSRAA